MSSVSSYSPSPPTTPRDSEESSQRLSGETSRDISDMNSVIGQGDSDEKARQEESDSRNADEDQQEALLFAIPPVHHQLMGEGDSNIVESMSVSMLLPHEKVSTEMASKLQRKYLTLVDALQRSQSEERNLLIQARDLSKTLNEQRKVLDKAADFPDNTRTEGGKLRKQILECENDLAQSTERMEQLEYDIRLLMEEKKEVENDLHKKPKREDIERKIHEITSEIEDLQYSLKKTTEEATQLKSDVKAQQERIDNVRTELVDLARAEDKLKDDLVKARTGPQVIAKEIDTLRKDIIGAENEKLEQEEQMRIADQKVSESEEAVDRLTEASARIDAEIKGFGTNSEKIQYELERMKKDSDTEKDREATLLEDRATQELQLRHRSSELRSLHETVASRLKEKSKTMKVVKAGELQLKVLQEAVEQQLAIIGNLDEKRQVSVMIVAENKSRLEDVRADLDQMRHWVATQAGVEEAERSKVERQMDLEQRMKAQVKAWQEKLHDIKKDVVAHTKARDREAKEVQKAEHTKWRVNDSLKSKKSAIEESTKSLSHLEQQLKEYSSAYEMVKTERNKTMSLIQHASQIQTELREKVHVLENEKEILRTAVDNKEKLLQKCALVHSHKVMERDTLRQEMSRKVNLQSDLSGEMEQQRSTIERLLNKINEAEAAMNQLRKRYESAVQERNEEGLKLIERNEELSIFYEKLNLQDSILQKASLQLKCREDDIHFLNMEIAELKRAISVCRKQTKDKKKLENDVVRHQIELLEAHESLLSLEKLVETPREARVRQLEGSDLTHGELQEKIEDLENKVADADEKLLEKELLHDQINRITERLDSKMKGVKTSGLNAAEKVLSYKLKIEEITRKMMALVSELTMQQAKARQMQQEVSEQESELEAAYSRLQSGDAPTDCIAEEWLRMERTQNMRRQETLTKKQAAAREDQYTLPDGTVSTANPRPNAYLPQGEMDLPLPKPYGALAPFRPSQPGSTMRHIRKPVPKPIDI